MPFKRFFNRRMVLSVLLIALVVTSGVFTGQDVSLFADGELEDNIVEELEHFDDEISTEFIDSDMDTLLQPGDYEDEWVIPKFEENPVTEYVDTQTFSGSDLKLDDFVNMEVDGGYQAVPFSFTDVKNDISFATDEDFAKMDDGIIGYETVPESELPDDIKNEVDGLTSHIDTSRQADQASDVGISPTSVVSKPPGILVSSKQQVSYNIVSATLSGGNLRLEGWGYPRSYKNLYSTNHRKRLLLNDKSTGTWYGYSTANTDVSLTAQQSAQGRKPCPAGTWAENSFDVNNCNFAVEGIGFNFNVNVGALPADKTYDAYLEVEMYGARGNEKNRTYYVPLFFPQPTPLRSTDSQYDKIVIATDFKQTVQRVLSKILYVPLGAGGAGATGHLRPKLGSGTIFGSNCVGIVAYFRNDSEWRNILAQQVSAKVGNQGQLTYFKYYWQPWGSCNNSHRKLPKVKEGSNTSYGPAIWVPNSFTDVSGKAMTIQITSRRTITERHVDRATGATLQANKNHVGYPGDSYNFKAITKANYKYHSVSGGATGNFNSGKTVTFYYDMVPGSVVVNKKMRYTGRGSTVDTNLAGAVFEFSDKSNFSSILATGTTNSAGKVTSAAWDKATTNIRPGTYYYREKSVPNTVTINTAIKSVKVTSGLTSTVNVFNTAKIGILNVNSTNVVGEKVQGIKFRLTERDPYTGVTHTTDLVTNSAGAVQFKGFRTNSALTLTMVSAPEIYHVRTGNIALPSFVTSSNVSTVTKTVNVVPALKKFAEVSFKSLEVYTQPGDKSLELIVELDVKKFFKDNVYHPFQNTLIDLTFAGNTSNFKSEKRSYTARNMPSKLTVPVHQNSVRGDGTKNNMSVTFTAKNEYFNYTGAYKIATDGYTSTNKTELKGSVDLSANLTHNTRGVYSTKYTTGTGSKIYYEHLNVKQTPIPKEVPTGYGFNYGLEAVYHNDKNETTPNGYGSSSNVMVDDKYFNNPTTSGTYGRRNLTVDNTLSLSGTKYTRKVIPKPVISKTGTGDIVAKSGSNVPNGYRDAGRKLYIDLWVGGANGTRKISYDNSVGGFGRNKMGINYTGNNTLRTNMIGDLSSSTIDKDAIVIMPVLTSDPFAGYAVNSHGVKAPKNITRAMMNKINEWNAR